MKPYYEHSTGSLYHGDCLEIMKNIPDGSVDMILCDLPYGTTQNKWDSVIPFEQLWEQYWRVCKSNAVIALTAGQPFTSSLIMSQIKHFKYCWIWDKVNPTGFGNAKKQPLRNYEDICVFYIKQCLYNPQMVEGKLNHSQGNKKNRIFSENYNGGFKRAEDITSGLKYPKQIQIFPKHSSQCGLHPTQKPVDLFEYLIKTYTNEGMTVLDNCIGSGTTAIAAINTNRKWIGIEKEEKYCEVTKNRIKELPIPLNDFIEE